MVYVGAFSSPLREMIPTQVDLPPCNALDLHLVQVERTTGESRSRKAVDTGGKTDTILFVEKRRKHSLPSKP